METLTPSTCNSTQSSDHQNKRSQRTSHQAPITKRQSSTESLTKDTNKRQPANKK
jgi:hypothetical protein